MSRPSAVAGNGEAPLADSALMRLVVADDVGAFSAIYDRHVGAIHGLAFRMLRERAAAEDVAQEVFIALWRSRDRYRPDRGSLRGWLLAITRNRAIDATRRRRHDVTAEPGDAPDREAPERTDEQALLRLEAASIGMALRTLPDSQRQAVELTYFGGLTQAEIAARLGIPLGTVKGRLRLALRKLATQLDAPAAGAARSAAI